MGKFKTSRDTMPSDESLLRRLRGIANYQFNQQIGDVLFPRGCIIEVSSRSQRIKRVSYKSQILATVRANDGRLVLTYWGGQRLHRKVTFPLLRVIVPTEIGSFIREGKSVFAKHVLQVDSQLRAGDEVLIVDEEDSLLAVGTTKISPREMVALSRGVAVKNRHPASKAKPA
jgi:uncharacterized protein with predicted RNA binding PUA domain